MRDVSLTNETAISIFNIDQVHSLPVLSQVHSYLKNGWPDNVPEQLQPYQSRLVELGLADDCLMWGIRVIVPGYLQSEV